MTVSEWTLRTMVISDWIMATMVISDYHYISYSVYNNTLFINTEIT